MICDRDDVCCLWTDDRGHRDVVGWASDEVRWALDGVGNNAHTDDILSGGAVAQDVKYLRAKGQTTLVPVLFFEFIMNR